MPGIGRRSFLRLALTVALAQKARRARARSRRARVLVLGAGMAGLAAASELQSRGHEVIVLEARDRLGGRTWTDHTLGAPVDLGGSWIHGPKDNPLTPLARRFGVELAPTDWAEIEATDAVGRPVDCEDARKAIDRMEEAIGLARERAAGLDRDAPLEAGFRQALRELDPTPLERAIAGWFLKLEAFDQAADLDTVSWRTNNDDEVLEGGDRLVINGYGRIAEGLAQGLDLRLSTAVRVLERTSGAVRVHSDREVFEADAAVVTLPLGVLKSGAVEFRPALPARKRRALAGLAMGVMNKYALRFERPFWSGAHPLLAWFSDGPLDIPCFLDLHRYTGQPILVGYLGGRAAAKLEELPDGAVVEHVLRSLRRTVQAEVPDPIGHMVTRWGKDRWSEGSYSYVPIGGTFDYYDDLARPWGRRVFFAGEATSRQFPATVHGAYLSGVRAAREASRAV